MRGLNTSRVTFGRPTIGRSQSENGNARARGRPMLNEDILHYCACIIDCGSRLAISGVQGLDDRSLFLDRRRKCNTPKKKKSKSCRDFPKKPSGTQTCRTLVAGDGSGFAALWSDFVAHARRCLRGTRKAIKLLARAGEGWEVLFGGGGVLCLMSIYHYDLSESEGDGEAGRQVPVDGAIMLYLHPVYAWEPTRAIENVYSEFKNPSEVTQEYWYTLRTTEDLSCTRRHLSTHTSTSPCSSHKPVK
ncbi:hypothetical protein J6590_020995 [Homalodisca vitripennis]|nr:hypothetical protein J6590_020995 [Homalodisca vitripennis]